MTPDRDYAEQVRRLAEDTRPPLQLLPGGDQPKPAAADLAAQQVEDAIRMGERDFSGAPRWAWRTLDDRLDVMLPGDLVAIGGLHGNGKTSFMLTQLDAFAKQRTPVLYVPLETNPRTIRRRWAAWELGLDWPAVARNRWQDFADPDATHGAHNAMMARQAGYPVQFPDDRRVSVEGLADWVRWGLREYQAQVVIIDHFHRMSFGNVAQYRIAVTEAARELKDLAERHQIVILATAQLNHRDTDKLDKYMPPTLERLKESSGLSEETDAVLMLSRRLKHVLNKQDALLVRMGYKSDADFAAPGIMCVTCRKHRLDDAIRDRTMLLQVDRSGHVHDCRDPGWPSTPDEP